MKILDTNLWVYGTLRTHEQAIEYLAAIERGEFTAAINAYMVQEAPGAFDRVESRSSAERDTDKTAFLTRLTRMAGLVQASSSGDVRESLNPILEARNPKLKSRRLLVRVVTDTHG